MPDMLCSLINLPPVRPLLLELEAKGITIRRANPWESSAVREYVEQAFGKAWSDEIAVAFARQPVSCFLAVREKQIIGFAAYECTRRDYFGPTGVDENLRGLGVGKALFLASLLGLLELGYTYAIIGGAGPVDFYRKCVGAIPVPFENGNGIYPLQKDPRLYAE